MRRTYTFVFPKVDRYVYKIITVCLGLGPAISFACMDPPAGRAAPPIALHCLAHGMWLFLEWHSWCFWGGLWPPPLWDEYLGGRAGPNPNPWTLGSVCASGSWPPAALGTYCSWPSGGSHLTNVSCHYPSGQVASGIRALQGLSDAPAVFLVWSPFYTALLFFFIDQSWLWWFSTYHHWL